MAPSAANITITTPHCRSLARPRRSNTSIGTASYTAPTSTPLPATAKIDDHSVQSASARKASLGRAISSSDSHTLNGGAAYERVTAKRSSSGPTAMIQLTPAVNRTVNGDKIGNADVNVGDVVDVPGGMHGVVKFIGEVKGKKGIFAGVELSREWAPRGKNDGDVEGIRYFTTSIPGAGIFLPSSKAFKRSASTALFDSVPATPNTQTLAASNTGGWPQSHAQTPPTPLTSKFSQSVAPGKAVSPATRPKSRPSLPRPESPLRRTQNVNSTPVGRPSIGAPKFSKNVVGTARYAPSPTPGKFGSSMRASKESTSIDPGKRQWPSHKPETKTYGRPQSRSQSRLGPESMFDEEADPPPIGVAKTFYGPQGTISRSRPGSDTEIELQRLRMKLEERDKQLEEQTASLAEMENSIAELQSSMPRHTLGGVARGSRGSGIDDLEASQLRLALREKNEKIAALTADFDAHRADFRSTIDTLELASTETERVYEKRVEDLTQELRELQDRGDDVESVAQQLKQLEELVQELEEGLEDARRGEAEARGEVEFLRGEVERGRSELRREREKATAALKGAGSAKERGTSPTKISRDVEQRDDEIRGLKAIIHSLSRDMVPDVANSKNGGRRVSKQSNDSVGQTNGHNQDINEDRHAREILEREVKELESVVDRKTYREEELEREIAILRKAAAAATSNKHASSGSNGISERTIIAGKRSSGRDSRGFQQNHEWREPLSSPINHRQGTRPMDPMPETDIHSTGTDNSNLWCEICETAGHEILTCSNMFVTSTTNNHPTTANPQHQAPPKSSLESQRTGRDVVTEGLKSMVTSSPNPPQTQPENEHSSQQQQPQEQQEHSSPAPPTSHYDTLGREDVRGMDTVEEGALVPGKASGTVDASKWCALCERDGHESVDCPSEDIY